MAGCDNIVEVSLYSAYKYDKDLQKQKEEIVIYATDGMSECAIEEGDLKTAKKLLSDPIKLIKELWLSSSGYEFDEMEKNIIGYESIRIMGKFTELSIEDLEKLFGKNYNEIYDGE